MTLKMLSAPALAAAFCAAPAAADPGAGWTLIGVKEVLDRTDRDTIIVEGSRQFEDVKLCVHRAPVRFYDMDIRFRNGGEQDVKLAQRIREGKCTRAIDLNGDDRDIVSVTFLYEATSRETERALIELFAR